MTDVTQRLAPSARQLLERALREALSSGKNAIEADHILLAAARDVRADHERVATAVELIAEHVHRRRNG